MLVSSTNGLGHARRLLHFAKGLSHFAEVEIMASERNIKFLEHEARDLDLQRMNWHPIPPTGLDGLLMSKKGNPLNLNVPHETERRLLRSNAVISDNSVWPAAVHPRVFLMGHFLWSDYFSSVPSEEISDDLRDLISRERSNLDRVQKWFYTRDFTRLPEIAIMERSEVPLIRYSTDPSLLSDSKIRSEIWLARGTTGLFRAKEFLRTQVRLEETSKFRFGETPRLVMGRSGLGTIRDCLAYGVPFIPVESRGNPELKNNADVYKTLLRKWGADVEKLSLKNAQTLSIQDLNDVREASKKAWMSISINSADLAKKITSEMATRL